jgi:transcriptional regulator with XRE-family HTH domain
MPVTTDRLLAATQARAALRDGRVRKLRVRLGLSQRELAEAVGADESALSRWEAGLRVPRTAVAERLGLVLRALEETLESAKPAVGADFRTSRDDDVEPNGTSAR